MKRSNVEIKENGIEWHEEGTCTWLRSAFVQVRDGHVEFRSGGALIPDLMMTPDEARHIAKLLQTAADHVERGK